MRRETIFLASMALALVACGEAGDDDARRATPAVPGGSAAVATFATYDASVVPGGPGDGKRYALGHAPVAAELARMDRAIGEAGAELPAGHGTVAEGAALFAVQCAVCHGKSGEGVAPAFPRLIGRDPAGENFAFANDPKLERSIGNYWPYATTLFDYIRRAMPLTAPGSLTDDQIYAVSAYLLAANNVIPDTTTLDAATLRQVRMPYRDRFVPDARKGGSVVK
jgi:cytochrome c